jgi:hypothetical protein
MKTSSVCAIAGFILAIPSLVAQDNVMPPSRYPVEARTHLVKGTTLFRDAVTPGDYAQIENEFKQAVDLAPQWPDARYYLALAKEATGDYSGALADLKLYQQFKLSPDDAYKAKVKIYALEAKTAATAKLQAAVQLNSAAEEDGKRNYEEGKKQAYQNKLGFLEGAWSATSTLPPRFHLQASQFQAGITITGNDIVIKSADGSQMLKGTIQGDDYNSINWTYQQGPNPIIPLPDCTIKVTVDKDGHQIKWKTPGINTAKSGSWDWTNPSEVVLTR